MHRSFPMHAVPEYRHCRQLETPICAFPFSSVRGSTSTYRTPKRSASIRSIRAKMLKVDGETCDLVDVDEIAKGYKAGDGYIEITDEGHRGDRGGADPQHQHPFVRAPRSTIFT
jgi:hypothetical protein